MLKSEEIREKIEVKKAQIEKREQLKAKYIAKTSPDEYWFESEVKSHDDKLRDLNFQLNNLQSQLEKQLNKENVIKIPAIEALLDQWEVAYREYVVNSFKRFKDLKKIAKSADEKFMKENPDFNYGSAHYSDKERWELYKKLVGSKYEEYRQYASTHPELGWDKKRLEKEIIAEKNSRRMDLVERVTKVVGEIKDCKCLRFGNNLGINGIVVGNKCSASVETIYAGGYNIQCLHFRVLVKPIK